MAKKSAETAAEPKAESVFSSIFQMFGVAVVTLTAYHFALGGVEEKQDADPTASGIVVVQTKALVQAQIDAATKAIAEGAQLNREQLEAQGQNFGAEFLQAVRRYSDKGLVVLDKKFAVGVPDGVDVTQEMAAELGLDVQAEPDPFNTPVAAR